MKNYDVLGAWNLQIHNNSRGKSHLFRLERKRNLLKRDQNDYFECRAIPGFLKRFRAQKWCRNLLLEQIICKYPDTYSIYAKVTM
jgi:hypothetical protein